MLKLDIYNYLLMTLLFIFIVILLKKYLFINKLKSEIVILKVQRNNDLKQISKYILFQIELNHRIKNNFQHLVSMFTYYKFENSKNKNLFDLLNKVESKIYAMSTIHNELSEINSYSKLNFNKFLKISVSNYITIYKIDSNINFFIECNDDFFIEHDTVSPISYLLNELICNSLKHGFKDIQSGIINIKFYKDCNDYFTLIYSDNGVGFCDNQIKSRHSIGLDLVNLLVKQINGKIEKLQSSGTTYVINFPSYSMNYE